MRKVKLLVLYDTRFYQRQIEGSLSSARIILSILYKIYHPVSVVDFGCGRGCWLKTAELMGSSVLKGFDGPWVERASILSKNIDFSPVNMEDSIRLDKKYDLAISVEVAEHLSEKRAASFVYDICTASDVIIFGAATKFQGGTHHINEKPQSYWVELFKAQGFQCFDIFRNQVWDNNNVEWWYKQNTLLFVNVNTDKSRVNMDVIKSMEKPIFDIIHPSNLSSKMLIVDKLKFMYLLIKPIYRIFRNRDT